jgi:hypothetical protein
MSTFPLAVDHRSSDPASTGARVLAVRTDLLHLFDPATGLAIRS